MAERNADNASERLVNDKYNFQLHTTNFKIQNSQNVIQRARCLGTGFGSKLEEDARGTVEKHTLPSVNLDLQKLLSSELDWRHICHQTFAQTRSRQN